MINQKLSRVCVCLIIFFSVRVGFAFVYDIESHLMSDDLRLAAIGNIDLVVEALNNEINAYDFGQSPAGIIEDDDGKSMVYMPIVYGFTQMGDLYTEYEWSGLNFGLKGVFKYQSQFAFGGSIGRTRADVTSSIIDGGESYTDNRNNYDTLFAGCRIYRSLALGLRGSFQRNATRIESPYDESSYGHGTDCYEPSVLLSPIGKYWKVALNYRLKKYNGYTTHGFALPIIFSAQNLKYGLRPFLETRPNISPIKSVEFRSVYTLPMNDRQVNLGFMLKGASHYTSEQYYFIYADELALSAGLGVAYIDKNIALLGVQYKIDLIKVSETLPAFQQHFINLGAELYKINYVPIRIGYASIGSDNEPFNPSYRIVTAGFGIKIPGNSIAFDFVYNLKYLTYAATGLETDHIFGLSGRYIF